MSRMNKRRVHHAYRWFRSVRPRYFLLAAGVCSLVCVVALRANNQHMAELREQVYAVDKSGGDVQAALRDLQSYVTAHMNTSLSTGNATVYPPIQLQYSYERLQQQEANKLNPNNGDLYTQAQAYCQTQNSSDFSGRNRVPCIEQYVQDHGAKTGALTTISPSLYQFDFIAPKWSPDLAGWSLFATILLLLVAAAKLIADFELKQYFKR